jgi:hypothetical protein
MLHFVNDITVSTCYILLMTLLCLHVTPSSNFHQKPHTAACSLPTLKAFPAAILWESSKHLCNLLQAPHVTNWGFAGSLLKFRTRFYVCCLLYLLSGIAAGVKQPLQNYYSTLRQRNRAWFDTRVGEDSVECSVCFVWWSAVESGVARAVLS